MMVSHFFNKDENQHCVGPFPNPEYYGVDYMANKEREDFMKWHDTKKNQIFDFETEILEYCRSDVVILRQSCIKFRHLLMSATGTQIEKINKKGQVVTDIVGGVDPFDYTTIASVCMGIFKTKFLEETWHIKFKDDDHWIEARKVDDRFYLQVNHEWQELIPEQCKSIVKKEFIKSSIARVPGDKYGQTYQYGKSSIQWLNWMMFRTNLHIEHALNGGKVSLPGTRYKLDGFCVSTNTAYEYHGCIFHGCPTCFPNDRDNIKHPRTAQSMEELYALTMKKKQYIESLGLHYVCNWEHEFHQQYKQNYDMKKFIDDLDIVERLNPRDSFFGGRTNASKLHYKAKHKEEIKYVDFTSLYP
jgi:hypothetical protein